MVMRTATLYTLKQQEVCVDSDSVRLHERVRFADDGTMLTFNHSIKTTDIPIHHIHRGKGEDVFLAFHPEVLDVVEFLGRAELEQRIAQMEVRMCALQGEASSLRHDANDYQARWYAACHHRAGIVEQLRTFTEASLLTRLIYALRGKLP